MDAVAFAAREQAAPFFDAGVLRRGTPVFELFEDADRVGIGDGDATRVGRELRGVYETMMTRP